MVASKRLSFESCSSGRVLYNMKTRRKSPGKINHIDGLKSAHTIIESQKITCQLLDAIPYVDLSTSMVDAEHCSKAVTLPNDKINLKPTTRNGLKHNNRKEKNVLVIKRRKKVSNKLIENVPSDESQPTVSIENPSKNNTKEVWRSPRLNKGKNRLRTWTPKEISPKKKILPAKNNKYGKNKSHDSFKIVNESRNFIRMPRKRLNLMRRVQKAEALKNTEIVELSDSGQYSSSDDNLEKSYKKNDEKDLVKSSSNTNSDDQLDHANEKNGSDNETLRNSSVGAQNVLSDSEPIKASRKKPVQKLYSSDDECEKEPDNADNDSVLNKRKTRAINRKAKQTCIATDDSNSDVTPVKKSCKVVDFDKSEGSHDEESKNVAGEEKDSNISSKQENTISESKKAKRGREADSDSLQTKKRSKITRLAENEESDTGIIEDSENNESTIHTTEDDPDEVQDCADEVTQENGDDNKDSKEELSPTSTNHKETEIEKDKLNVTEEVTILFVESDEESTNKDCPSATKDSPKRRRLTLGKINKKPSKGKRLSTKKKIIEEPADTIEIDEESNDKNSANSSPKKSPKITTEELLGVLSGDQEFSPDRTLLIQDSNQLLHDAREDLSTQIEPADKTENDAIEAEDTGNADVTVASNSSLTPEQKSKNKTHPSNSFRIRFAKGFKYSQFECDTCNKLFSTNVDLQLHCLQHLDNRSIEVILFRASLPLRFNTANQDVEKYLKPRPRRSIKQTNVDELKNLVMKYCNNKSYLEPFDTYLEGDVSYASMSETNSTSRADNVTILSNILVNDFNDTEVDDDIDDKISKTNVDTFTDSSSSQDATEEPDVEHANTHSESQTNVTKKDNLSSLHRGSSNENISNPADKISSDSDDFFSVASPTEIESLNLEIPDDQGAVSPSKLSDVSETESLDHTQKICKLDDELHSLLRARSSDVGKN